MSVPVQVPHDDVTEVPGDVEVEQTILPPVVPISRRDVPDQQNLGSKQEQSSAEVA